jgi:hypothetical protein
MDDCHSSVELQQSQRARKNASSQLAALSYELARKGGQVGGKKVSKPPHCGAQQHTALEVGEKSDSTRRRGADPSIIIIIIMFG